MKAIHGQELKAPLVSLTFYEPQADLVVSYQPVANELENTDGFEVSTLTAAIPDVRPARLQTLEEAAKLAFPANRAERRAANRHKAPARGLALASKAKRKAKRGAARKKAAKKKAPKRKVARKAAKRAAAKRKAPKKKVARKRAHG